MNAIKPILASIVVAGSLMLAFQATADEKKPQGMGMMQHSDASMQMHMAMMDGGKMTMPMTGNVDRDFAAMMIMHHQQALKMADVEIAHGNNAELKAMAVKMRADQAAEIKKLEGFK